MKVLDGVLGFAIGDSLGVPVEFVSRENLLLNPVLDMEEYGTHNQVKGTWSDDTSMVIATMDSIINNKKIDYEKIMDNFCLWYSGKKFNPHDVVFDIGITTSNSINNYVNGKDINSCGCSGYYDNGNGSLMRILPLSYYFMENNFSDEEMILIVNKVSSLTHAHPISCLGSYLYTRFIMFLLSGMSVKDSYLSLGKLDLSMYDLDTVIVYKRFLEGELCNLSVDKIKSSGFVVSTLEASIWCNLTSSSYSEVVLKAVNFGDDTDTVGALAGAVAGITYGVLSIPKNWLDSLVKKDYLEDLSSSFEEVICKYKVNVKE